MKKIIRNILLVTLVFVTSFNMVNAESVIKEGAIEKYQNTHMFIINYSNMIYKIEDKNVVIPIFHGYMGDITYQDFRDYCSEKKFLDKGYRESGFIIQCKRGEIKKTFHEFLKFYKGNILKDVDIEHPAFMEVFEKRLFIRYECKVEDIKILIEITICVTEDFDTSKIKSVFDIDCINENFGNGKFSPYFIFEISVIKTRSK